MGAAVAATLDQWCQRSAEVAILQRRRGFIPGGRTYTKSRRVSSGRVAGRHGATVWLTLGRELLHCFCYVSLQALKIAFDQSRITGKMVGCAFG